MVNEAIVGKGFPPFEFLVERGKIVDGMTIAAWKLARKHL